MSFGDIEIKSTGKFLKIDTGVPHDIRILNESPNQKIVHGFGKEAVMCEGEDCVACRDGSDPRQRFFTNVYDYGNKKVMIWEFGPMVAKQLKAIDIACREEKMKITDRDLKVEATGSDKNKKYVVTARISSKSIPSGLVLHELDGEGEIPF